MIKYFKFLNSILFISCVFWFSSCSKKYLKGTIYMGSGGGFTGSYKEYQLNSNGELFFQQSDVDSVFYIKSLDSTATKKLFRKYYKLKLDREDLDAPGNKYFYVGRREGKFRNHKITFGNPEADDTKIIKQFYNEFSKAISDSTKIKHVK
jgi:hypothetical protein